MNDLLGSLYGTSEGEKAAFGTHWHAPGILPHGEKTSVAWYLGSGDGQSVEVFCTAMPARFYTLVVTLAQAYHAHHFNCPACIAAGGGHGQRCGTGTRLWSDYQKVCAALLRPIMGRCKEDAGCLIWTGATNDADHPKLHNRSARRAVWELTNGPIPEGNLVSVSCGRPACLFHLKLTTKSEVAKLTNARPDVKLKRSVKSAAKNRPTLGKIDMDIARQFRASKKMGIELAAEFGVSPSLVSNVRQYKTWVEHLTPWTGLGA